MKLKIIIPILLAVSIILDILDGDILAPTVFDFVKWGCMIICLICYLIYVKKEAKK